MIFLLQSNNPPKAKTGGYTYSENPLTDDDIKKDEMMELTPESSNNSLRTPSPPVSQKNKAVYTTTSVNMLGQ